MMFKRMRVFIFFSNVVVLSRCNYNHSRVFESLAQKFIISGRSCFRYNAISTGVLRDDALQWFHYHAVTRRRYIIRTYKFLVSYEDVFVDKTMDVFPGQVCWLKSTPGTDFKTDIQVAYRIISQEKKNKSKTNTC